MNPTRSKKAREPVEVRFPRTGVFALESRHARGFAMPPTRHDYLKALLVFAGEGRLHSAGRERSLATGDVAVVPPGCEHWIEDRRPLSLYALCFRAEEFLPGWRDILRGSGEPWLFRGMAEEPLTLARRLLHEQTARRAATDAMTRGLAWQMLALLARLPRETSAGRGGDEDGGSRGRVAEAARALRHRFYEPLRIDDEARRAGLGRRRFTQLFREVNGTTWWEALTAARLDHAEHLFADTDRSVAAVAFECGYGDLSGFYRAWSARHAASPQAWRLEREIRGARPAGAAPRKPAGRRLSS